jgi:hypothetical protein
MKLCSIVNLEIFNLVTLLHGAQLDTKKNLINLLYDMALNSTPRKLSFCYFMKLCSIVNLEIFNLVTL